MTVDLGGTDYVFLGDDQAKHRDRQYRLDFDG